MGIERGFVYSKVKVPIEWLDGLEENLELKLEDLSEEQWQTILSFALGTVDYSKNGIHDDMRQIIGMKGRNTCIICQRPVDSDHQVLKNGKACDKCLYE